MQREGTTEELHDDFPPTWHICWQAAVGRDFFIDPALYHRIRWRLIDAHRVRGRNLVYYVLLPNELHVISQITEPDTAGSVARAIGNVVARWVREAQPVRSPVMAGPFRAHRIASVQELRSDARILAWRPVLQGLCRTPVHYPHGALRIALGLTPAQGYDSRALLRRFGDSVIEARASLRSWVAKRPTEREWRLWELTRGLVLATGSVGPRPAMATEVRQFSAAMLLAAAGKDGIDGALRLLETWVSAKLDPRASPNLHAASDPKGSRGRALVGCLATDHGLCSAASVARYFGRAKATLSEQMTACRKRLEDRSILDVPVQRIVEEAMSLKPAAGRSGE